MQQACDLWHAEQRLQGELADFCFLFFIAFNYTFNQMIISFKHKGLVELFEHGISRRVRSDLQRRCLRRLEVLDQAESLTDLNIPGFNFHGLQGVPKRHSIHVNGPWCITFEWQEGNALRVNLEQYH